MHSFVARVGSLVRLGTAVLVGACSVASATYGCGSSNVGASNDSPDGAAPDGATTDGSTGNSDGAALDGASTDGGANSDGAVRGVSCAAYPGALFCDDFEYADAATFANNWLAAPGCILPEVTTSASAFSPVHVLRASADYGDGGVSTNKCEGVSYYRNQNELDASPLPPTLRTTFSMRIVSYAGLPVPDVFGLLEIANPHGSVGSGCYVRFGGGSQGQTFSVSVASKPSSIPFALGQWQRIEVTSTFGDVDASAESDVTTVKVDGVVVATGQCGAVAYDHVGAPDRMALHLGATSNVASTSTVVEFDDVVIEQN